MMAANGTPANARSQSNRTKKELLMKKIILIAAAIFSSVYGMAQAQLAFPFQGGAPVMSTFFKDSVMVSPEIVKKGATGTAVFKFTADTKGAITRVVIYYADDYLLVAPLIEALKKSIIPDNEKTHDFVLPFSIRFVTPAVATKALEKHVYDFNTQRKPITNDNQIPLNSATLLPTVTITYELGQ
jgi:hypothetical protein